MRVFVTGASGHIGSVVVPELIAAGHDVLGLARSDSSAAALRAAGAQVHRGDLDDTDSLRAGAAAAGGVIHLAFKHDWGDFASAAATDLRAIEAIGDVLAGSGRPFVSTSGTLMLTMAGPLGRTGTEEDTVAEAIGRHLNVPTASIPPGDEAMAHFGFLGALVSLDNPTSRALTEKLLDWQPTHPGLIADLAEGHYFC